MLETGTAELPIPHANRSIPATRRPPLQLPIGAPLQHVCVGAEWHRFPSSFFLPGPSYRLQFVKSGFTGLLPRQYDPAQVTGKAGHSLLPQGRHLHRGC